MLPGRQFERRSIDRLLKSRNEEVSEPNAVIRFLSSLIDDVEVTIVPRSRNNDVTV